MDIREKARLCLAEVLKGISNYQKNHIWLKDAVVEGVMTEQEVMDAAIMQVIKALDSKASLVDTAVAIGRKLRGKVKQNERDPLKELMGGLLVVEAYDRTGLLQVRRMKVRGRKQPKHPPYVVAFDDIDVYNQFMIEINDESVNIDEAPRRGPAEDWDGSVNDNGENIIRHGHSSALEMFNEEQERVYYALNKLQNTGYNVNERVFAVYKHYRKQDKGTPFKYEKETNIDAKRSMEIEARAIEVLADRHLDHAFFHRYSCDFRGRIYPNTPYLNEQSSDNAKGLLVYDHKVPFGPNGHIFLAIHTANSIGEDKLPLSGRVKYVEDNAEEIISWAEDPYNNTGWMDADKAWSTLACAYVWKDYYDWVERDGLPSEEFMSDLPIFIDGSNNGVQHLTALSLDETTAHLVNLDPTECEETSVPGDIYMFIAEKVWERVGELDAEIPQEDRDQMQRLLDEARELKLRYEAAHNDRNSRTKIFEEIVEWRTANRELNRKLWPTFWNIVEKPSTRRKCVKRPVMTLGYGVTRAGCREQLFDDTKGLTPELTYKEKTWVNPFGDLVYDTCYEELKGPAMMLNLFRSLAEVANTEDEFLKWTVPFTGFPVVQAYEPTYKISRDAPYKGKRLQLTLELKFQYLSKQMKEKVIKDKNTVSKKDQLSGAAPNIVHSLDAGHLTMVVNTADFPVTMVHDSFGCHIGNMDKLFNIVRQTFADLYHADPLALILDELGAMDIMPERGNLNLDDVMQSHFAFC